MLRSCTMAGSVRFLAQAILLFVPLSSPFSFLGSNNRGTFLLKVTGDKFGETSQSARTGPGPDSHILLQQLYPALESYQEEYGHPNIPLGSTAGRKCESLRRLHIQNKLSKEDVELLDSMGFRWHSLEDVYRAADFYELFYRLTEYGKVNDGEVSPPKKYGADPELGAWVTGIRRIGPDSIPDDHKDRLNEIGFQWVSNRVCGSAFMKQYRLILQQIDDAEDDNYQKNAWLEVKANLKWLKAQQLVHQQKSLSATRVHYMEELLGMDWETRQLD
mmetsp:Transcript_6896/g.8943  ORF Transcript_6896/g.8943 Transcript_6896/m.8943 type:complete len:274 (+) Transcript_6896:52-873(+)